MRLPNGNYTVAVHVTGPNGEHGCGGREVKPGDPEWDIEERLFRGLLAYCIEMSQRTGIPLADLMAPSSLVGVEI